MGWEDRTFYGRLVFFPWFRRIDNVYSWELFAEGLMGEDTAGRSLIVPKDDDQEA
jgi:hypothetical protein